MALMNAIKYKDYTFPYNPSSIKIESNKRVIEHEYPGINGVEIEEMALGGRIISGRGSFYGKNAYKSYSMLESWYNTLGDGILTIPKYGSMKASFTRLSQSQEPLPNYVEYDFEFKEHTEITAFSISNTKQRSFDSKNYPSNWVGLIELTRNAWLFKSANGAASNVINIYPTGKVFGVESKSNGFYKVNGGYIAEEFAKYLGTLTFKMLKDYGFTGSTIVNDDEKIVGNIYHTVSDGETLQGISKLYYGTTSKWKNIADANKSKVTDPNNLLAGWILLIP